MLRYSGRAVAFAGTLAVVRVHSLWNIVSFLPGQSLHRQRSSLVQGPGPDGTSPAGQQVLIQGRLGWFVPLGPDRCNAF